MIKKNLNDGTFKTLLIFSIQDSDSQLKTEAVLTGLQHLKLDVVGEKLGILQLFQVARIGETVQCHHQEQPRFGILLRMTRQSLLKLILYIGTSAALDYFRFC